ncbi:GDP-mannose 4,6-dehydratase [bacterium]|nr:GDP-mannose 4,6-dehydratase [bacterium]
MPDKRALITGVTGQDGAYLSKLLLEKGYKVYGAHRPTASPNLWRLDELKIQNQIDFVPLDLLEFSNIQLLFEKIRPTEIYNLAAQSFVSKSFAQPLHTGDVDALGVARLLEAMRTTIPEARFYQASTSEMFGKVLAVPQNENTPFYPRSPYAVAKLYAHWLTINYRESYGMFACSGILFNHESPLRGIEFVTRKICSGLARWSRSQGAPVALGNVSARRDWGFAGDYVKGMWLMLQQASADDYVLATGQTHSVREFAEAAASTMGIQLEWQGSEGAEVGAIDYNTGKKVIEIHPSELRPADVECTQGDASKARINLGWTSEVGFEELVAMMARAELTRAHQGPLRHDPIFTGQG